MTSLFGVLSSASSSLKLIQGQLDVVSENVTKADDPDRTKHTLATTTDGSGNATVAQYTREVDRALQVQLQQTISEEASASTLSDYMTKVTDLLGTSTSTPAITQSMTDFQSAWTELAANPESSSAESQVIMYGEQLASEIQRLNDGINSLEAQLDSDISASVDDLNSALKEIDSLNASILKARSNGDDTTNMEDRRDALVREVAGLVSVRTVEQSDGRISIFTTSGLSLLDAQPVTFTYSNGVLRSTSSDRDVSSQITDGKLGALLELSADGSTEDPPQAASSASGAEVIRKLRSQLDAITQGFLGTTKSGEAASFADAYANASPTEDGELASRFFVGTSAGNIQVNSALTSGQQQLKTSAASSVSTALSDSSRTITADGLRATGVSYGSMISNMLSQWNTASKVVSEQATIASDFKTELTARYTNKTGVNLDEEIVQLQVLQRSYSAAARVMQTVNNMLDAIEGVLA